MRVDVPRGSAGRRRSSSSLWCRRRPDLTTMPPDIVWKNRPVRASLAQMESSLHQSVGRIVASNSLPPSRLDQSSLEVPPRKKRDKRDVLAPERLLGAFEAIDNRN